MRRVTPCGNLYQGNTGILAAGTCITLLGWRFATVSFPFARMTLDKMHLRLARKNSSIDEILYYSKDFRGILLQRHVGQTSKFGCILTLWGRNLATVEVEAERPRRGVFPFQHSGESVGHASRFQLKSSRNQVKFAISFMQKSFTCLGSNTQSLYGRTTMRMYKQQYRGRICNGQEYYVNLTTTE